MSSTNKLLKHLISARVTVYAPDSKTMNNKCVQDYSIEEAITRIINLNDGLTRFWESAEGWAPIESSSLLSKSRLDWQASLSRQLRILIKEDIAKEDGLLITGWALLGSLVEGTMKLFLSVWYEHYRAEEFKTDIRAIRNRTGVLIEPDALMLESLRVFFAKRIYTDVIREIWRKTGEKDWIDWIQKIQQRRNAIHSFQDREIGNFEELYSEIKNYLQFLRKLSGTFPYPDDEIYKPREL